jgi:hypothetical protein
MHLDLTPLDPAFLRLEASRVGIDGRRLRTAVAGGLVERAGRGLYLDLDRWPELPDARHLLLAAAAARAVPDSAVSHVSAALLHGLPTPLGRLPRPAVTVHDGSRSRSPGSWMTLFRGALTDDDTVVLDGRTVTSAARTVVDSARHIRLGDALAIIDAALRQRSTTIGDLLSERDRQRRWPGVVSAATALTLADPRRETWLESWSAAAFHRMALPRWFPQVVVHDEWGGFIGRVDGLWHELGVVAEADGRGKYLGTVDPNGDTSPEAVGRRLLAASDREVRLRAAGLGVVRWSTDEVVRSQPALRARWVSEVHRTDPRRIRASFTCSCCHRELTSCDFGAVYTASFGVEVPTSRTKSS